MERTFWLIVAVMTGLAFYAGLTEAAQGVFTPQAPRVGYWQFIGILLAPGTLSVILTIVVVRYMRAFALDDALRDQNNKPLGKRQVFWRTLGCGAFFGATSQVGLQKAVQYLTGLTPTWELVGLAVVITGPASMVAYEAIRWWMARKIMAGKKHWRPAYDWLSVKPEEKDPETGDDVGHLTRFMREDTTEPRE